MRTEINNDWKFYKKGEPQNATMVSLPHDAMFFEKRSKDAAGGINSSYYLGFDYVYEKEIDGRVLDKEMLYFFEFEGVYHNAEVFINDKFVIGHEYGYTGFTFEATDFLNFDGINVIKVTAENSDQPNCRWYSGAGLYRPVQMYILPKKHILLDGVKIQTKSYQSKEIEVDVQLSCGGEVTVEIYDGDLVVEKATAVVESGATFNFKLPKLQLWSEKNPKLYTARVKFFDDSQEVRFGIREVSCNAKTGLLINGVKTLLKGACIHHDNGLLGAAAYAFAERRKIEILKNAGFNSLRMAHNPCSKKLLDACDELGVLVLNEYVDMWYIPKTKFDYAKSMEKNWRTDLKDMVTVSFNHPSVVMYSTGNEVSESGQERGIKLCGDMTEYLHTLDNRPVTCGVNILFNYMSHLGFGIYSDKKANKKQEVGSAFFNKMAGIFDDKAMKIFATLHGCDVTTRDSFAAMDIAGYNYGILRYKKDFKRYPDRVILGSETFCNDARSFMLTAKENNALIGDFVWAGMDYLGEVGIGSWEYPSYAKNFNKDFGWISAGSGRIDLTGKPLCEMDYMAVAFEEKAIGMGVVPVDDYGKTHSPSAWKMSNAIPSWSWDGCEGKKTQVEVYSNAFRVELLLNDKIIGKKKVKKHSRTYFKVRYHSGELTAVSFDANDVEIARTSLKTGEKDTKLTLVPENEKVKLDDGLCYVRLKYTDIDGVTKPMARADISVVVTNGKLLALGNACPFNLRGYLSDTTDTYYGEALAIVKPLGKGVVTVNAKSKFGEVKAEIIVE